MTSYVVVHTIEGCLICKNISETDKTITVEVDSIIIEGVPKNIVTNYV